MKLQDFVAEGHTTEEVTEFAQQLNRQLPPIEDIPTAMLAMQAIAAIVRDLNGESNEQG